MSVLKLKPACKEYLWGGDRLIKEFHKEYDGEKLAETWELSCHPDGASTIVNGPWAGKSLAEYIDASGKEVLGKNCRRFQEFPILIKFIDAKDNLSIQVHPDNSYALKNESQYGKTEMWYVVDCKEGAFLYYGFAKEIDKDEFRERIENNTLLEVLNKVPVQKGDVFFIEAGTIHAIGKDIVIAEIQQNSNVTYRVYDYGRVDKEGKKRDLHIEKALEVTNRKPMLRSRSASPHLAKCDYFTVDKLNLDGRMMKKMVGMVTEDSFANLLIVEGKGAITCNGEQIDFAKGDSLFFPAGCGEFQLEGECEALISTIGEKVISDCRSMPDLMKSVNKILLSDEDSLLWELCGGDLDKITEDMIIQAAKEKDETAKKILHHYVSNFCAGAENSI
jgi:mannose-6-phosphate isomerase